MVFQKSADWFDALESKWDSTGGQKFLGTTLVIGFLLSIFVIEFNRRGWVPDRAASYIPLKHLAAIESAFLLLLIYEVVNLIFSLAKSISISVGKQFQVLSLFLLRDTFKEFAHFDEPLSWTQIKPELVPIFSTAVGALLIFIILIFYYRDLKHHPITKDISHKTYFILAKKNIALILLASFVFIIFLNLKNFILHQHTETTFESLYTMLIFSDVLIVLFSIRYSSSYHVAFRNSGFTVGTVMIRVSMIAPLVWASILGVGAMMFTLALSIAYNYSVKVLEDQQKRSEE